MNFEEYLTEATVSKSKFSSHEKKIMKTMDKLKEQLNDYKNDAIAFARQEGYDMSHFKNLYASDNNSYVFKEYMMQAIKSSVGDLVKDIKNKDIKAKKK